MKSNHGNNGYLSLVLRAERTVRVDAPCSKYFIFSAIVTGNFTDEDEENGIPNTPEHSLSKEFSLQRDDVQTTPSRNDHKLPGKTIIIFHPIVFHEWRESKNLFPE